MFGIDHELMPNFGISATFTYRYFNHFNWNSRDRRQLVELHADRHADRQRRSDRQFSTPFYAIDAERGAARRRHELRGAEGLPPALHRVRGQRRQAHVEQVDGALRVLDQLAQASTSTAPTRSTIRRTRSPTPNIDGGHGGDADRRQRQEQHLHGAAAVPVHRQRPVPGTVGHQLRGELALSAGLREPYFRSNVATGDPLSNNKSVLAVRRRHASSGCRAVSSLDARVEKAFKIQRANIMLDLDIFNIFNNGDRARPSVRHPPHRPDRLQQDAGDHEPAHPATRGADQLLGRDRGYTGPRGSSGSPGFFFFMALPVPAPTRDHVHDPFTRARDGNRRRRIAGRLWRRRRQ